MTTVLLPEMGESVDKATVSFWYVKVGDAVKAGDNLVELTTDKAAFNVPSPCQGIVTEVLVREGDVVKVGASLALIEER